MANIKTPDGGFYLDDSQFDVDYEENLVTLIGGGGTGEVDITADGGVFNADAILQGTDNLEITVPDAGESATVGITPESVTLTHNTNRASDGSFRVASNAVEIKAGATTVQVNGTGVNFGGGALSNIASIGASSSAIAFENDMDMNSHKITGLADPTGTTDAMTKNYGDTTYATKSEIAGFITNDDLPVAATTAVAGLVKQAAAVADSSGATDTALEAKFNELLVALRNAGILAPNA